MRQSTYNQGQQQPLLEEDDFAYERPALTNTKLAVLIFSTFGLIVAIYAMR
jgi:hypothetical protein